jgi:hypothetical protein
MKEKSSRDTSTQATSVVAARVAALGIVVIAGVIVLASLGLASASTTIVFNNFGPGDTYGYNGEFVGRFEGCVGHNPIAGDFIPDGSGKFNELWTAMFHDQGDVNIVTIALLSDDSGRPGAAMWQRTFVDQLSQGYGGTLHVADIDGPNLIGGTRYWIQASMPDIAGSTQCWMSNDQGDIGLIARTESDYGIRMWSDRPRLALRVGVVPEPSSLVLLSCGIIGLVVCVWRRCKAVGS